MTDKLNLIKQQMNKTLEKESDTFNKNHNKFQNLKSSLAKKNEVDYNESNGLLNSNGNNENNDDEYSKYKVSDKQINYMDDIAKYRKDKYSQFYSQTLIVQKITNDINQLTHQQDKKIEQIGDHLEPVLINSKETFKKLLETSNNDKKFKSNNCCIIAIILLAIFLSMMVLINFQRK